MCLKQPVPGLEISRGLAAIVNVRDSFTDLKRISHREYPDILIGQFLYPVWQRFSTDCVMILGREVVYADTLTDHLSEYGTIAGC